MIVVSICRWRGRWRLREKTGLSGIEIKSRHLASTLTTSRVFHNWATRSNTAWRQSAAVAPRWLDCSVLSVTDFNTHFNSIFPPPTSQNYTPNTRHTFNFQRIETSMRLNLPHENFKPRAAYWCVCCHLLDN